MGEGIVMKGRKTTEVKLVIATDRCYCHLTQIVQLSVIYLAGKMPSADVFILMLCGHIIHLLLRVMCLQDVGVIYTNELEQIRGDDLQFFRAVFWSSEHVTANYQVHYI